MRFLLFSGVGLSGVAVQLGTLALLHQSLKLSFLVAQTLSIAVSMLSNFILNNRITFRAQRLRGRAWCRGLLSFAIACSLGAIVNLVAAQVILRLDAQWLFAALIGTGAGSVFNYLSTERTTWSTVRRHSRRQS